MSFYFGYFFLALIKEPIFVLHMQTSEISTSGVLPDSSTELSGRFSDFIELKRMSFCRLVKAKRFGRWFVLKCLQPEFVGKPFYECLLQKEAEITLRLDHQNLIRCYGWEDVNTYGHCLVLEFIDGVALTDFLKTNPKTGVLKRIVDDVLEAMDYYHSLQVIHRDLKPSNIMVTRNGLRAKIIDFGLSDTDNYAVLKQPAGTLLYMAPEQKEGVVDIDARSDIYSFGVLLQQMFANRWSPIYSSLSKKCANPDREKRLQSVSDIHLFLKRCRYVMAALPIIIILLALVGAVTLQSKHQSANLSIRCDTVRVVTEVEKKVIDTVYVKNITGKVVHDTIRVGFQLPKERRDAQMQMAAFVNKQMAPVKERAEKGAFMYDMTFQTSLTYCYLFCQKQLRNEMKNRVSATYPKAILFHDIDSVVAHLTSCLRSEYEDQLPSYVEAYSAFTSQLEQDTTLSAFERKRLYDDFQKKYDENVLKP